jgi:hypothetical protein
MPTRTALGLRATEQDLQDGMHLTRREARRLDRQVRRMSASVTGVASDKRSLRDRFFGETKDQQSTTATPGPKGWIVPGAGRVNHIEPQPEGFGTSVHVCGLWPFALGAGAPIVGVPLGRHLLNGSTVCADPISWFLTKRINNPSCFIIGRPHLGKSALTKRIITVLRAWGVLPMVLSDTKGEYSDLIKELAGQVIRLGRGQSAVNPLDFVSIMAELRQIGEGIEDPAARAQAMKRRDEALEEMRGRRMTTFMGLLSIARNGRLENHESNVIAAALAMLDERFTEAAPLIEDVAALIRSRPERLAEIVQDRGDEERYRDRTEALLDTLGTLTGTGTFGGMFARATTERVEMGQAFSFDLSAIPESEVELLGAVQSVCWNYGSALVSAQKHLSEAGLRRSQHYFLVMDELWLALRASNSIVYYLDALTRLNRQRGIGQAMITHTMDDLRLSTDELTKIAWGFVSRSAMVFLGGLSEGEMGNLATVFSMTKRERGMITDWSGEGSDTGPDGVTAEPPGRGKFLLKIGKRPGTPLKLHLTAREMGTNDTNRNWTDGAEAGYDTLGAAA